MKAEKFFALIISLIVVTNSFTLVYQKIYQNEEKANYDRERAQRYSDRILHEAKLHHEIEEYKSRLRLCEYSDN